MNRKYYIGSRTLRMVGIILILCFMPIIFIFTDVATVNASDSQMVSKISIGGTNKGIHVYAFPMGDDGFENGRLWIYVEELDSQGKPKPAKEINIKVAIRGFKADEMVEELQIKLLSTVSGEGLYSDNIALAFSDDIKYVVSYSVDDSSDENSFNLDAIMYDAPLLQNNSYSVKYKYNETVNTKNNQGITINWDNISLFRRIYTVEYYYNPEMQISIVENSGNSALYYFTVRNLTKGNVDIKFKDPNGIEYNRAFAIMVEQEGIPLYLLVALGVFIILIALLIGLMIFRNINGTKDDRSVAVKSVGDANVGEERYDLRKRFENTQETLQNLKLRLKKEENNTSLLLREAGKTSDDNEYIQLYDRSRREELENNYEQVKKDYAECERNGDSYDINISMKQLEDLRIFYTEALKRVKEYNSNLKTKIEVQRLANMPLQMSVLLEVKYDACPKERFVLVRGESKCGNLSEIRAVKTNAIFGENYPELKDLKVWNNENHKDCLIFSLEGNYMLNEKDAPVHEFEVQKNSQNKYILIDSDLKKVGTILIKTM